MVSVILCIRDCVFFQNTILFFICSELLFDMAKLCLCLTLRITIVTVSPDLSGNYEILHMKPAEKFIF